MPEPDQLETIGAFARRVGLTPSALRFYDEHGLLAPAVVDAATGYRWYAAAQLGRARLLRRLREAQLPLSLATTVLDGDPTAAAEVLRRHLRRLEEEYEPARRAATGLLDDLGAVEAGDRVTRVVLAGVDLAGAVRHVVPAAAPPRDPGPPDQHPALGCVRVEVVAGEVTLVASDRLRLSVRTLVPVEGEGPDVALLVPAGELEAAAGWAGSRHEVTVTAHPREESVVLAGGGEHRRVAVMQAPYPGWRAALARVGRPRARAVVDRRALLRELVTDRGDEPVVLDVDPGRSRLTVSRGSTTAHLRGTCTGSRVAVAFARGVLAAALEAGVGPDVVLEIAGPRQAVVVRSADAGTATTLAMPLGTDPATAAAAAVDGEAPTSSSRPATGGGTSPLVHLP